MSKTFTYTVVFILTAIALPLNAQKKVLTTTPDLADLAQQIGGKLVAASSLTDGSEDLHLVKIRPSTLIKVRRTEMMIISGMGAEHAWLNALLRAARNKKIKPGSPNYIDASRGIRPLRVPDSLDKKRGVDFHPLGNPHYTLDPTRMRTAAKTILAAFIRVMPGQSAQLKKNFGTWDKKLNQKLESWRKSLKKHEGKFFIEHHDAWVYFASCFKLKIAARLESRPGLAPSASHITEVISLGKEKKVQLVVARPQNAALARRVAHDIKAKDLIMPLRSQSQGKLKGWFEFMDHVVESFAKNLGPTS